MKLLLCLCLLVFDMSACTALDGERIFARDLAGAIPSFLAAKPETEFGPSPSPGVKRIFSRAQLTRFAAAAEIPPENLPELLCVERRQAVLDPAVVLASIADAARAVFPDEELRVEILDYLRYPLPPGVLSFRRQGVLGGSSKKLDAPVLWRGSLTTESKRTLPVWAKATVLVKRHCWIAKMELAAGVEPGKEQFERSEQWLNPFSAAADCADLLDKKVRLRRSLKPGQLLFRSDLAFTPPVRRGEIVQASIEIASATLSFDAVSEMDGLDGQSVFIKRKGRRLRARVTGAGAVQIIPGDSK